MLSPRLVLASASPGRLGLLHAAGIDPLVEVSGVDEDAVDELDPDAMVAILAQRKAEAVAARRSEGLVVGADSTLVLDGVALGKPHTAEEATARWRRQRGRAGVLATGHHVIDAASGRRAGAVARTAVHFADIDDETIAAYVGTGEPLEVAGAFTLDGYGAAFVERVEGDPSNVIGLSLPLLRRLLADIGVEWRTLWR
ncbi:Maf family nucleotide pyrophosphatase [Acidiferrimicrobium sp. IK]|uniref:Maf family protein n=1 Tax=Acidiferrimicrobium sp. IK TaxID=2871700 RepID=UPI0021CB0C47|nr:nucleoside triphosphate pyrophosphatase [Acidiferrimicrobium sp. IK]MCU4183411.1 Maf family nucleotide pyrophosphatase [Acidiferrimicrobium sp. IK]